jgi:hypothetical protein
MNAIFVVIGLKAAEFSLEISSSPKRNLIEKFAPYRPDESFNKGMRQGYVRDGFQFRHLEDSKIGSPLPVFKEWIVIAAQMAGRDMLTSQDLVE